MDKKCSKCKEWKKFSEFHLNKSRKDGYDHKCKECKKNYQKENTARLTEYQMEYYQEHRQGIIERVRQYAIDNIEKISKAKKAYFQNHRADEMRRHREYKQNHPDEYRQYQKEYQRKYRQTEKGQSAQRATHIKTRTNHPEKYNARKAVNHAVEYNKIPNVKTLICSVCNKSQASHYHHHKGYAQEFWLDVVPVCAICHEAIHRED